MPESITSNGSIELEQLQQQRAVAVCALETAQARCALHLLEASGSSSTSQHWGQVVDPLGWRNEDADFGQLIGPLSPAARGYAGHSLHVLSSEQALATARNVGRAFITSSATAIGILKNLTNFCIGTGFTYKAAPCHSVANVDSNASLVAAVQKMIDDFLDDNDWCGNFERELFVRSRRDGEFFLAFFPQTSGRINVRVIEPEQITEPADPRALERHLGIGAASSWSFGIQTAVSDVQSIHGYHVLWNSTSNDWDYLPAQRVEHLKLNVDRNVKRGLSDFFAVRAELEGAEKLLRNTREGAAVQAAIAFIREHLPAATSGQIHDLAGLASLSRTTPPPGQRPHFLTRYEPGTILDVSHGMQYKPGPLGSSHAPNFIAIQQAVLRSIGTRWCMPEYMVSGDASNANYSSSLVAESPFVKFCQAEQRFYASHFRRVLWKVIGLAHELGEFDAWNIDLAALRQQVSIRVDVPSVVVRDSLAETQSREIEYRNGVLSQKTWAAETGRAFETEQRNRNAEQPTGATSE